MRKKLHFKESTLLIIKIESCALLIVVLFSYFQFFNWKGAAPFGLLGIILDILMLLFALFNILMKKSTSLVPGLGWLAYFISCAFYNQLIFLKIEVSNSLSLSLYKALEFLLLSCFHLLCLRLAGVLLAKNTPSKSQND
jgi:hypothetical protein